MEMVEDNVGEMSVVVDKRAIPLTRMLRVFLEREVVSPEALVRSLWEHRVKA
jgi:hypothetical protein